MRETKATNIIGNDYDGISEYLFENSQLSPNSGCMRLLRESIYCGEDQTIWQMAEGFKIFSERVNKHPDRDWLLYQIVGSWYHSTYWPMLEELDDDIATGETDPAFFLRHRREDLRDPLRLRKRPRPAAKPVQRVNKKR